MPSSWKLLNTLDNLVEVPEKPGIYALYVLNKLVYVGQSENLRSRLLNHRGDIKSGKRPARLYQVTVKYKIMRKIGAWLSLECALVARLQPEWNKRIQAASAYKKTTQSPAIERPFKVSPRISKNLGKRFGKLTLVAHVGGDKYRCICDCGSEVFFFIGQLTTLKRPVRSCGCGEENGYKIPSAINHLEPIDTFST